MSKDSSEIDQEVAEQVMGWESGKSGPCNWKQWFTPSTRIEHAWEVKKAIQNMEFSTRRQFCLALTKNGRIRAGELIAWPDLIFFLEPIDICRAALYSVVDQ